MNSIAPATLRARADLIDAGARTFAGLLVLVGMLALLSAVSSVFTGTAGHLGVYRAGLGALFVVLAGVTEFVRRRVHARAASALALTVVMLSMGTYAILAQLGVHALMFAAAMLVIALAGILVSMRLAVLLTALHFVLLVLMFLAERHGYIAGFAALTPVQTNERMITHPILAISGLAVAYLVSRVIEGSFERASLHERQLRELLLMGSDWIWEQDARGMMVSLSPEFEARTGRSVAEFMRLGQPDGPKVVMDAEAAALYDAMRSRRPYRDRSVTFTCSDGAQLVFCGSGEPLYGVDGQLLGWRGVSRNVTADVMARREQQRTQAMLDRMVRMSPDPIYVSRRDGTMLMANDEFLRMAGRTLDEVVGQRIVRLGLWNAEDAIRLRDALLRFGVVRQFKATMMSADKGPRTVSVTGATFEWDGEPAAVITTRDITESERVRVESDAILDNASVGIALVRDRHFQRVNPPFEHMFGHAPGTLDGAPTAALFPDDQRFRAFAEKSDAWQRDDGHIDIERRVMRKDGSRFIARLLARPLDSARPLDGGTIWVAEDVTARRRAEQELAEAKRQAEAASEAKSAFLATMSHEIRTPLNGVLGLARLLQEESLDAARRAEYLRHLMSAAEQLTGIVSDVLDLSKIEAGQLDIENIEFDLHHMVHDTFNTFALLGQERGLDMECIVAGSLPLRVLGDPMRVRQILANYLSNALKFTDRGRITMAVEPGGEDRIRFSVTDSGIGLTDSLRAKLFKPFTQADSSTTRRFGGTGLGLSICAQLAARMGGEVGADRASAAEGSCFWVELTLPPVMPDAGAASPSSSPQMALAGVRVIVAEDNPVNLLIVTAMLNRAGAEVLPAEDGEQALELARLHAQQTPGVHAILMDLHMPRLDGLAATRKLRQTSWGSTLPVYAVSAAVLDQERRDAQDAGMNGFIAKPVEIAELLRVLLPLARREPATAA